GLARRSRPRGAGARPRRASHAPAGRQGGGRIRPPPPVRFDDRARSTVAAPPLACAGPLARARRCRRLHAGSSDRGTARSASRVRRATTVCWRVSTVAWQNGCEMPRRSAIELPAASEIEAVPLHFCHFWFPGIGGNKILETGEGLPFLWLSV